MSKLANVDLSVTLDGTVLQPADVVRDLGVTFDSQLNMKRYVNMLEGSCFNHFVTFKKFSVT